MVGTRQPDTPGFTPRSPHHRRRALKPRAGFTLIEILLVLAVMTAMLAISWPSLSAIQARHQLRQSAEMVQVRMVAARVHALESGTTYQFCFEPNGRRYVVVPSDMTAALSASGSTSSGSAPTGSQQSAQTTIECLAGELESRVHFDATGWQSGITVPDTVLSNLPDPSLYSGVQWAGPVQFNPDGTSTGGQLLVTDTKKHSLKILVRPLTGGVTITSGE